MPSEGGVKMACNHPTPLASLGTLSSRGGNSRMLPVGIDRDHLPRDRLGRGRGQKHRERGDVLRIDEVLDRLIRERLVLDFLHRAAGQLRLAAEDALDAVALDQRPARWRWRGCSIRQARWRASWSGR